MGGKKEVPVILYFYVYFNNSLFPCKKGKKSLLKISPQTKQVSI